ncbi:YveK family protein [Actinophytocola xanthii]|uniref:Exopolysaccharide biosynthesis protein n=1 Tax=Actinophytocola xanthii TaxID=1912961 RepID=A0A1Q8CMZ2_9PSEU|nr:exopolysaccharide biosynthesis protein [Actinophytocola xanthii]OLF15726.1 exopolysaccharide biosynthesis protein [Actinophytocola xanthii]
MTEDTVRLSVVGQVLKRRWRLLIVFAVLGAVAGAGASLVFSPGYETSANVLLQGPRDADELLTEAQVAQSSVVLDRTAAGLRWGVPGKDLADDVSAQVAEGNIIEVTGRADSPERAQQLADRVAQEYVTYSTQLLSDTADSAAQVSQEQQQNLRQQILDTNQRISDLHASAGEGNTIDSVGVRTELESLRTALSQAMTKLDELDAASTQAKMVVMGPAERPAGPAAPTMTHFAGGGAAAFLLIGLFGHLLAARSDRRLRGEAQIVSALGADVLGGVDVADEPGDTAGTGRRGLLRRFFLGERDWHLPALPPPADEEGLEIRYRRVVSRLRESTPSGPSGLLPRVLVVVPDDDPAARRAAQRLARTAAAGPARATLRVAEVSAARPIVPDANVAGALVVVTAGTRTGWELVGIHEACTDAGHDVLGVVVTHRTRPLGQAGPTEAPEVPVDSVMAGSA